MIFTSYFKINNYSANTLTTTFAETSGWTLIVILWSPCSLMGPPESWTSLLSISIPLFENASAISLVPTEPYKAPSSVTGTCISQDEPSIDSDLAVAWVSWSAEAAASSSFLNSTSSIFLSLANAAFFFVVLRSFWHSLNLLQLHLLFHQVFEFCLIVLFSWCSLIDACQCKAREPKI